mgnify:CR=1 FL=1
MKDTYSKGGFDNIRWRNKMKYRIVSEKLLESVISFIGDIQLSAAEEHDYVLVDYCNSVIDDLLNCDRAIVKGKIKPDDKPKNNTDTQFMKDNGYYDPYDFGRFSPDEMKYLYDSFKRISEQLGGNKEDKKKTENKSKKTKPTFEPFKPSLEDIVEHMSLEEIKDYLINEPELTDNERFELYYDERERRKPKEKGLSYNQLLKKSGLKPPSAKK